MKLPLSVSVVMCTYNGEAFLDAQLASILQQDATITELIIADDRSTDGTWGKLQTWQKKYPFIKIIRNESNLGYNKNFEKVISLATSDLVALADQDDIWLPQKISRILPAFQDPTVMLAHCRSVQLKNEQLNYHKTKLHYHFSGTDIRRFFFFGHIMGHDAIFRRSIVQQVLPIPNGVIYDWWISVNALTRGRIASIPEFLVHHRIHAHNNFFSKTAPSKKKELDLNETLRTFATIPTLQPSDRQYLQTLIKLIEQKMDMPEDQFSMPLFRFLYKYRYVIFGHKKRLFPEFTYLKYALKYARFNYKGKGISI